MKKNVVIVGLGLIGGSLAKAFQKYSECTVSGMDCDPSVLDAALKCGAIDRIAGEQELREADILYLCLYPQADIDFIQAHGAQIPPHCIVTDTCGIKREICAHLPKLAEQFGFSFVGGYPARRISSTAPATFWSLVARPNVPWTR